jgi:hypothetical protein
MRVAHNLDTRSRSIGHVDTTGHTDLSNAEVSQASDLKLWAHDNAEARSGVIAYSHIYGKIGLLMAQVDLQRSTADGKVGALLLDIVITATREIASS